MKSHNASCKPTRCIYNQVGEISEHPGRGVYRSSYKNAHRLAVTEINMAYRTADNTRWQQLDFVLGQHVLLSNNHTLNGKPFFDICDELSGKDENDKKGRYPREFKFTGWHPLCRCHVVPIMLTPEEMKAKTDAALNGEEYTPKSKRITEMPPEFEQWMEDNKDRIERARKRGTLPYYVKDAEDMRKMVVNKTSEGFYALKFVGTGEVYTHILVDEKDSDYKELEEVAEFFARRGSIVHITPKMTRPQQFSYESIYGNLIGTRYEGKCPDMRVDGIWYEHEGFVSNNPKRAFQNMLNHGLKQSSRIVIKKPELTERWMIHNIMVRISKEKQMIDEVWIKDGSNIKLLFKKSRGVKNSPL